MGNKGSKSNACSDQLDSVYKHKQNHFVEFRLSNINSRSFWGLDSQHSLNSETKFSSTVYRRRSKASTRTLPSELSKTTWPVSQAESYFLPEFPVAHSQQDNKYEIIAEINRGAFGKVYKVKQLEKNEIFALKVLSKHKILTENCIKQVKEEVQIQKICGHHPFIVNCVVNWQTRKQLFIVTEYIEGGELWHLLQNLGVLPIEIIQLYVVQIASAIDFLHNAGIIYRDLKPENILLDLNDNLKLIDFGLSKWLSYGSTTSTVCGTPRYMAPEVLKMIPYSHSVDWWSLGVIVCLMFTSQWPILNLNSKEDEESIASVTLPTNVFLDVPYRDLLLRLLEVDPRKRLKSIRKLETIAFYKGYNMEEAKSKIKGRDLLVKHFGENYHNFCDTVQSFDGFDEIFINE